MHIENAFNALFSILILYKQIIELYSKSILTNFVHVTAILLLFVLIENKKNKQINIICS